MLQFNNETGFEGTIAVLPDPDGVETVFVILKATFDVGRELTPAAEQVPVTMEDVHWGEPGKSSLKAASDIALVKPSTDVILNGRAYAPGGHPTGETKVSLAVENVEKSIRVVGDRAWSVGLFGCKPSEPVPFEVMPLVWERAFGGTVIHPENPEQVAAEVRNPVGLGYCESLARDQLEGRRLPNLEHPDQPVTAWTDRPTPVCLGPVCAHWEPRRSLAGTYDEAWTNNRAPYLPHDFDSRFFQVASADQVTTEYLRGGETIVTEGLVPGGGLWSVTLPRLQVECLHRTDSGDVERTANLDTVLLEPDAARVELVWRSAHPTDKRTRGVREVSLTARYS